MPDFYDLLAILRLIGAYTEGKLGGKVKFDNDKKGKGIILRWEKYDKTTKKTLRFNHKISYIEMKTIKEPFAIADKIIAKYQEKEKK